MFLTIAGTPAGYGYFEKDSVADVNIMPDLKTALNLGDKNNIGAPISIGTMSIQVDADCKVSINERNPILVKPDTGLTFDARGVYSVIFKDAGKKYNICVSY